MTTDLKASSVDVVLRRVLSLIYGLLVAAGILGTFFRPPAMAEQMAPWQIKVWALYLLIGALACLLGVVVPQDWTGQWAGEYVGIWLTGSAVGIYGIVAITTVNEVPGRWPGGLILLSAGLLFAVRWLRVRDEKNKERRDLSYRPQH